METPDLQQEVMRGRQAQELLEHPILAIYFEQAEERIRTSFLNDSSLTPENLKDLQRMWRVVEGMRAHLTGFVETGKFAEFQLNQGGQYGS